MRVVLLLSDIRCQYLQFASQDRTCLVQVSASAAQVLLGQALAVHLFGTRRATSCDEVVKFSGAVKIHRLLCGQRSATASLGRSPV